MTLTGITETWASFRPDLVPRKMEGLRRAARSKGEWSVWPRRGGRFAESESAVATSPGRWNQDDARTQCYEGRRLVSGAKSDMVPGAMER